MLPYFCLEPQALNYLIDDQPLDSITLAYDYAPNTDERHMNQVLDKMLDSAGSPRRPVEPSIATRN